MSFNKNVFDILSEDAQRR